MNKTFHNFVIEGQVFEEKEVGSLNNLFDKALLAPLLPHTREFFFCLCL